MAETAAPEKPRPTPTPVSQGFWDGTREGRLMLQRCGACGTIRHYPQPLCPRCQSMAVEWVEASGRGRVHSWTVAHHAYHPAFKGEVPYVLVTVDLEEGVRQMGRLEGDKPPGDSAGRLRLGLPVRLFFEPAADGYGLPAFRIEDERSGEDAR